MKVLPRVYRSIVANLLQNYEKNMGQNFFDTNKTNWTVSIAEYN